MLTQEHGKQVFVMKNSSSNEIFTGWIMRENEAIAEIKNDVVVWSNENAPLFIKRGGDFNVWLADRGADLSRS
jgi:hypothetical protein